MYLCSLSVDSRRLWQTGHFQLSKATAFHIKRQILSMDIYKWMLESFKSFYFSVLWYRYRSLYIHREAVKQIFLSVYNIFFIDQNVDKYILKMIFYWLSWLFVPGWWMQLPFEYLKLSLLEEVLALTAGAKQSVCCAIITSSPFPLALIILFTGTSQCSWYV